MDHLLIPSVRSKLDVAFDVGFAATVIGWSFALVRAADRPLPVALGLVAVNAAVAVGFLRRSASLDEGSMRTIGLSLPSIVLSGFAYRLASADWPVPLMVAHDLFALVAVIAIVSLGRSFSVLPTRRTIVARGPYRWVRHPIYLAELGMLVCAALTRGWIAGAGAVVLVALLLAPRIVAEERLLGADPSYADYRARVRYRLLPGVF